MALIDPMGSEATRQFPCFEHPTLVDLLDSNGITWKYYAPSAGSIWTGPNAIQHLRFGADWQKIIIPQTTVLTDIANGQLARVTWVIPDGRASDHAPVQRRERAFVGGFNYERHWEQLVLVDHGNLHHLGRLGRLV